MVRIKELSSELELEIKYTFGLMHNNNFTLLSLDKVCRDDRGVSDSADKGDRQGRKLATRFQHSRGEYFSGVPAQSSVALRPNKATQRFLPRFLKDMRTACPLNLKLPIQLIVLHDTDRVNDTVQIGSRR